MNVQPADVARRDGGDERLCRRLGAQEPAPFCLEIALRVPLRRVEQGHFNQMRHARSTEGGKCEGLSFKTVSMRSSVEKSAGACLDIRFGARKIT
jgi:hypothetical protein